jgi:CBS domain-containing protein
MGITRTVGELASRPLLTVAEHVSLYRVRAMLTERRIRHIGAVRDDGALA